MLLPAGHERPDGVDQRTKSRARAAEQVCKKRGWQAWATDAELGPSTEVRGCRVAAGVWTDRRSLNLFLPCLPPLVSHMSLKTEECRVRND